MTKKTKHCNTLTLLCESKQDIGFFHSKVLLHTTGLSEIWIIQHKSLFNAYFTIVLQLLTKAHTLIHLKDFSEFFRKTRLSSRTQGNTVSNRYKNCHFVGKVFI